MATMKMMIMMMIIIIIIIIIINDYNNNNNNNVNIVRMPDNYTQKSCIPYNQG
jgi:uncharacterized membrane protein